MSFSRVISDSRYITLHLKTPLFHLENQNHSVSLVLIRYSSLSLAKSLIILLCHSLPFVGHSLSLVVIRCHLLYYSLSLHVPLVCLYIAYQKWIIFLIQTRSEQQHRISGGQCPPKNRVMSDESCFTKDAVVRRKVTKIISYRRLKTQKYSVSIDRPCSGFYFKDIINPYNCLLKDANFSIKITND